MEVDRSDYETISGSRSNEELALQDWSDEFSSYSKEELDTHFKMSLLALLCCFPCGIVAICSSLKVNQYLRRGEMEEAIKASEKAELFSIRAFTCMFMFFLCQFLLFLSGLVLLICFAIDCNKRSCDW